MNCKNCNTPLTEESRFCNQCGGKVVTQVLTYRYLASEFSERFFNLDNLIIRTFRHLFTKPEEVIDGFINGVRKRHLGIGSYLALAITISGLQLFIIQKFFKHLMDASWMTQDNNPVAQDPSFLDSIWEYQSIMYIVFIPIYAIIAKTTFWNYKKYNYLEHIVIVSYTQAQMSLTLFLPYLIGLSFGINFFKLNYVFILVMMIYSAHCYKRLYQISLKKIIVKTLFFLLILFVALIIWSIVFWAYLLASGTVDLQEMIEAEKAKKAVSYITSFSKNWTS